MIKIIKHGQTEFNCTCDRCGCEFTYEREDVTLSSFVICPDCGEHCYIGGNKYSQPKIGWPTPGEPIPCSPNESNRLDPCKDCDWTKKLFDEINYVGDIPCTWCSKGPYKVTCGTDSASISTSESLNNSLRAIKGIADYSGIPNNCTVDTVSSSLRKCNCDGQCEKQARLKAFKLKLEGNLNENIYYKRYALWS